MSFSTLEIVGIAIGGTGMIIVWIVGIVSSVRFYSSPATAETRTLLSTEKRVIVHNPAQWS